jgi:hypothetical protein
VRTIISGSRVLKEYRLVEEAVARSGFPIAAILSGHARGVDRLGERYAQEHGIPCELWQPAWHVYGRRAGLIRNEDMAQNAHALIAVWDGRSSDTRHLIGTARRLGLKIHVAKA